MISGSDIAKSGFINEEEIAEKFNNWKTDREAKNWLSIFGYEISSIKAVKAVRITKSKPDISVEIETNNKQDDKQYISIKLVSSKSGFNQIDKRWVSKYKELWDIPDKVVTILKQFTGEIKPQTGLGRRMLTNFSESDQKAVIEFFETNKTRVLQTCLSGDSGEIAQWLIVTHKRGHEKNWFIYPIRHVIDFYSRGNTIITKRGNLKIGNITMQRKGGDGGKPTANQLQFKFNASLLVD